MKTPLLTEDDLMKILLAAIDEAGGQRKWAMRHGLSNTLLSYVLHGTRSLGKVVPHALGYRRRMMFVRLEEDDERKRLEEMDEHA